MHSQEALVEVTPDEQHFIATVIAVKGVTSIGSPFAHTSVAQVVTKEDYKKVVAHPSDTEHAPSNNCLIGGIVMDVHQDAEHFY